MSCRGFLHLCSPGVLARGFLFLWCPCLVLVSGWCWPCRMSLEVFPPFFFFGRSLRLGIKSLNVLEFTSQAVWSWTFVCWEVFDSISLVLTGLVDFLFPYHSASEHGMFLGICPSLLGCPICSQCLSYDPSYFCCVRRYLFHFWFEPCLFFSWWVKLKVCQFCLSFQRTSP